MDYRDMDYDDAYNNRDYIPGADDFIETWEDRAVEFRSLEAAIGRARLNLGYGAHPREAFDLFLPAGRPAGLMVFVHGGYWRAFDRGYWSHFAVGAQALDWAVAMPSYTLAPEAGISQITAQIAAAVTAAAAMVAGPIVLAGHSAGGHLVARMACTDTGLGPEVTDRIAHVIPISPVADLRPLRHTAMNADFQLDEAEARTESPVLCTPRDLPVTTWVGAEERPAFLEQARALAEAWPGAALKIAPGRHHFDVIDHLEDPGSAMLAPLRDTRDQA